MPFPITTAEVFEVAICGTVANTGGIDVRQVHVSAGTYERCRVRQDGFLAATVVRQNVADLHAPW
jgi:hypothetical protein